MSMHDLSYTKKNCVEGVWKSNSISDLSCSSKSLCTGSPLVVLRQNPTPDAPHPPVCLLSIWKLHRLKHKTEANEVSSSARHCGKLMKKNACSFPRWSTKPSCCLLERYMYLLKAPRIRTGRDQGVPRSGSCGRTLRRGLRADSQSPALCPVSRPYPGNLGSVSQSATLLEENQQFNCSWSKLINLWIDHVFSRKLQKHTHPRLFAAFEKGAKSYWSRPSFTSDETFACAYAPCLSPSSVGQVSSQDVTPPGKMSALTDVSTALTCHCPMDVIPLWHVTLADVTPLWLVNPPSSARRRPSWLNLKQMGQILDC